MMRKIIYSLALVLVVAACDSGDVVKSNGIKISDVYSFETPGDFSAGAVFMTIENTGDEDKMIAFNTDYAGRTELHTMAMVGDVMKMRRVGDYTISAGGSHTLRPGGDHVMLFGITNKVGAGETFEGVAVFENAGEIPVTVHMRDRSEMTAE